MKSFKSPLLTLHLTVVIMGAVGLFARTIDLPAWDIIGYRTIIATVALFLWLACTRVRITFDQPHNYGRILILGLLLGGHWITYFHSMQISSIAIGMIALYSYPVITVLIEPIFTGERLDWRDFLSGFVVLLGVYCLIPDFDMTNQITQGVLWGLLSALLFALRNVLVGHWFRQQSAAQVLGYQSLVVAVCLLPVLYLSESRPSAEDLGLIFILAIVFTAIAHAMLGYSLRFLRAKTVGLVSCLQPVYGAFYAFILLGSQPDFWTIVGGLLIGVTALYESLREHGKRG